MLAGGPTLGQGVSDFDRGPTAAGPGEHRAARSQNKKPRPNSYSTGNHRGVTLRFLQTSFGDSHFATPRCESSKMSQAQSDWRFPPGSHKREERQAWEAITTGMEAINGPTVRGQ